MASSCCRCYLSPVDYVGPAKQNNTMRIRNVICSALAVGLFGLFVGCATEKEERERGEGKESQAKLQAEAKITKAQAEQTALAKVPGGTIKEGGLEREKGKLIYSFDIATPGTKDITEVAVDAINGEVIAVDKETPAQQEQEKKADAKEKKGKKDKDDDDEKDERK